MTTEFWRWLSRANARLVLLGAVAAFLVTAAYWVWRELDAPPAGAGVRPVLPPRAGEDEAAETNRVDLWAFVESHRLNGERAMSNPFYRSAIPVRAPPVQPPTVKPPVVAAPPTANPPPVKPPPVKPPVVAPPVVKPPPPPPVKETPVLFRGLMVRPDGVVTALLEDQAEKRQRYFAIGQSFLNGTVEALGMDEVVWKREDGVEMVLPRMEMVKIRER